MEGSCISDASGFVIASSFSRTESRNKRYDRPRVCLMVPGALELLGLSIISLWFRADMIRSVERFHSNTFGYVQVMNGVTS